MTKHLLSKLSAVALSLSIATGLPGIAMAQAPTVTDAQVDEYVRANLNDPAKIASAMAEYNVSLDRIQRATGYTRQQIIDYIERSNNAALKAHLAAWNPAPPQAPATPPQAPTAPPHAPAAPTHAPAAPPQTPAAPPKAPAAPPPVTDAQINEYIRANLNDPAKIAEAMVKYDVNLARIQKATGYTREQIADYVAKSNNAYLKKELESWNRSAPNGVVQAEYDAMPEQMKGGFQNGQPIIIVRETSEIEKLPPSMWRGMSSAAIEGSKAQIRRALEGDATATGAIVLGINGTAQVRVPAKADPGRVPPSLTAAEIAALKEKLKPLQAASQAAHSRLELCTRRPQAKCDAERRDFDRARMPVFDMTAAIAIGELDLLPSNAPQQTRFAATHNAAYTSNSAVKACMTTVEVTGHDCKAPFERAVKQASRMETVARDMLTQCIPTGTNCSGLRNQSDAMERTTRELKESFAAFEQKQANARAQNVDPKQADARKPAAEQKQADARKPAAEQKQADARKPAAEQKQADARPQRAGLNARPAVRARRRGK